MDLKKYLRFLPIIFLILGLVLFFVFGGGEFVRFETLRQHHEYLTLLVERNTVVMMVVYTMVYSVVVAFSVPIGLLMTITGGFLFGTFLGTLCVVFGATLGACVLFLAARSAFADIFRRKVGGWLERFEEGLKEDALSYMLVLRLVPLFPFWLVNIVPAFLGISFRTYALSTFLGIIPGVFVYASLGNGLGVLFERGETPDFGVMFTPEVLVPIIGLAILALVPIVYKRYVKKRDKG